MNVGCIILAGGKASRLGQDKVLATLGRMSLLQRVITRLRPVCAELIVVTGGDRDLSTLSAEPQPKIVTDVLPGKGPLGGIYTGLLASSYETNLVVASDMPFLNEALLRYMVGLAPGFDIVVPRLGKLVEPLHAVYSRQCIAPIEEMLKKERLSVNELLGLVKVRYVEAEEIDRFDPRHLSFFNINTKTDMETARQLAQETAN